MRMRNYVEYNSLIGGLLRLLEDCSLVIVIIHSALRLLVC